MTLRVWRGVKEGAESSVSEEPDSEDKGESSRVLESDGPEQDSAEHKNDLHERDKEHRLLVVSLDPCLFRVPSSAASYVGALGE